MCQNLSPLEVTFRSRFITGNGVDINEFKIKISPEHLKNGDKIILVSISVKIFS